MGEIIITLKDGNKITLSCSIDIKEMKEQVLRILRSNDKFLCTNEYIIRIDDITAIEFIEY